MLDRPDPILEQNFRPRVVVKFAVDVGQARRNAGWYASRPCQSDEELGVLVAIARPRLEHLERARHAERDAVGDRIVDPAVDALERRRADLAPCRRSAAPSATISRIRALNQRLGRVLAVARRPSGSDAALATQRAVRLRTSRPAYRRSDAGAGRQIESARVRRPPSRTRSASIRLPPCACSPRSPSSRGCRDRP